MGDFKSMQSFIWMLLFVFLIFVPGSTLNAIENTALTAAAVQQTNTTSTTKATKALGTAVTEIAVEASTATAATTKTLSSLLKDSDTVFLKTYSITQPVATPTTTTAAKNDAHTTTKLLTTTIPAGSLVRKATNVSISIGTKASLNSSSISTSRDTTATATTTTIISTSTIAKKSTTAAVAAAAAPPASAAQTITKEEQVTIAAQLVATLMSIAAATAAENNEKILNNANNGGDVVDDRAVNSSVDNKIIYNANSNKNNKNSSSNFNERSLSRKVINKNNYNDNILSIETITTTIANSTQQQTTNVQHNQHLRPLQKPKISNEKRNDQAQPQQFMYAHQQYQQQQLQQQPQQYKQQYTRQVQQLHASMPATAIQMPISITSSPSSPPPLTPISTKYADNLWGATIAGSNRNLIIFADKNLKKENVFETEVEKNNLKSIVATAIEITAATIGTATVATAAASSSSAIITVASAATTTTTLPLPTIATTTTRRRFIATTTMKPAPAIDDYQTVISQAGTHAYLPCNVKQLVKKPISWLRVRDGHILTVDQTTFIADQRFQSIYASNPERWSLQIKYVQLKDAGTYECQVSTEPKASAIVNLRIVEPKTELIGEPTRHVKAGSQVKLHCIISQALEPPLFINWFYNQKQIYLHNRKGWRTEIERIELPPLPPTTIPAATTTTTTTSQPDIIATTRETAAASSTSPIQAATATITALGSRNATAIGTETTRSAAAAVAAASMSLSPFNGSSIATQLAAIQAGAAAASAATFASIEKTTTTTTALPIMDVRQITTASLIIPAVEKLDSGNYTCIPSNSAPKTVVLHVLNGEYSASAITSGVNGNMIIGSYSRSNNKQRHLLAWQQLHTATTILTLLWIIEFVLIEENIWNFRRRRSAVVVENNKNNSSNGSNTSSSNSIDNTSNCCNRNNRIVAKATQFSSSTSNSKKNNKNESSSSSSSSNSYGDSSNNSNNNNSNNECIISKTPIAEKT